MSERAPKQSIDTAAGAANNRLSEFSKDPTDGVSQLEHEAKEARIREMEAWSNAMGALVGKSVELQAGAVDVQPGDTISTYTERQTQVAEDIANEGVLVPSEGVGTAGRDGHIRVKSADGSAVDQPTNLSVTRRRVGGSKTSVLRSPANFDPKAETEAYAHEG